MAKMIKNVVFDIGGVLADFRILEFLSEKGFDEKMAKRIIKCAVLSPYWEMFERGEITEEETLAGFARCDPRIVRELYRSFSNLTGMLIMRDFAIPLVRRLRQAGYKVFYLSNYSKKAYDECADSLAFMPYMDGGLVSFQVGMTKPSPEIYERFLDEYGLRPEECLFIDDSAINVDAARSLGFEGILFTTGADLVGELAAHGVDLEASPARLGRDGRIAGA